MGGICAICVELRPLGRVIVISVPLLPRFTRRMLTLATDINRGLKRHCVQVGFEVVDLDPVLLDPSGVVRPRWLTRDGVHLTSEGNRHFARFLRYLSEFSKSVKA